MPVPALSGALGALGSLFGGGSQSTANNAFQSTISLTPIISIGGNVGAETAAGGTSDAQADPTFSQSAVPSALGGVLGTTGQSLGTASVLPQACGAICERPTGRKQPPNPCIQL